MAEDLDPISPPRKRAWWWQPEPGMLLLLVLGIYFSRLTALPVRGEETRWARTATEMITTGDWIVPRQQGQPHLDRPPLASWAMALVGLVRGKVDLVAIRLPSVLAILFTSLLIYGYARSFLSRMGAFSGAVIYVTLGQVLQIGRLGENEALYTLLVSGSLLIWHWGYVCRWPVTLAWLAAYSLAALAALEKGLQAPVYFVAVTSFFLVLRRDWKYLICWSHLAGVGAFVLIIGIWLVPFYFMMHWNSAQLIWTQTITYRYAHGFSLGRFLEHLATYPFETFACLLPWSPLLLGWCSRQVRKSIEQIPPQVSFLVTALLVTYPSVWFATEGKTRYFVPLYPCIALLIAFTLEHFVISASVSPARRAWNRYLLVLAVLVPLGGFTVLGASLIPQFKSDQIGQPTVFAIAYAMFAAVTCWILLWARRDGGPAKAQLAVYLLAVFLGLSYTGAVINATVRRANDMTQAVDNLKQQLPRPDQLVSFGPVSHRFAYYYELPIEDLPWPLQATEVPDDVTYFCYDHHPGDTPQRRSNGRHFAWSFTPGTLPFEWQEIAVLPAGPHRNDKPQTKVVVGRILSRATTVADAPRDGSTK